MKGRLTVISIFFVALALSCNAYATPAGRVSRRGQAPTSRKSFVPTSIHSSGVYDLRRYLPQEARQDLVTKKNNSNSKNVSLITPLTSVNKKMVAKVLFPLVIALLLGLPGCRQILAENFFNLLASYKATMVRHPLQTKVATGAFLAVLGDALAQIREKSQAKYNPRRAASFAAFDGCYRFFQHNAFPFIISLCEGKVIGSILSSLPGVMIGPHLKHGLAALERTLVYQLVVIPLLYYPIFFTFTGYLQGLRPNEILQRAKTTFLPCWKKNLMFWIPTQMVMFGLIDEYWQIPFACVMGMLWSMILSVTAGNAKAAATSKKA